VIPTLIITSKTNRMAYSNSGFQRAVSITIGKYVNGIKTEETSISLLPAFSYGGVSYVVLTADSLMKLSITDYKARVTAFLGKISADYADLQVDATGSRIYNPAACPI